jgi:hypothetical protein
VSESRHAAVIAELRASLKWAAILFVPAVVVLLLILTELGGFEGRGGYVIEFVFAPVIATAPYLSNALQLFVDLFGPIGTLALAFGYFYLITLVARVLIVRALIRPLLRWLDGASADSSD